MWYTGRMKRVAKFIHRHAIAVTVYVALFWAAFFCGIYVYWASVIRAL